MRVGVKLNASLRRFLPKDSSDGIVWVELAEGATVSDAVHELGIPSTHAKIAVSGNDQLDLSSRLRDGQQIGLFPPLAGGV